MYNLLEIFKNDWSTYYNYRTKEKSPPVKMTIAMVVFSALIALFDHTKFTNFLNAVLSIEAILVGFSFSVMFFLLSENKKIEGSDFPREKKVLLKKLDDLSKEIFYNVSYFNLVSIISLLIALILLLPNYEFRIHSAFGIFQKYVANVSKIGGALEDLIKITGPVLSWALWTSLYVTLLQSLFTLVRTVMRVNFYFSEKMKFQK